MKNEETFEVLFLTSWFATDFSTVSLWND